MRISVFRPRLEQRPRRKNIDVALLEEARRAAQREASRIRLV